MARNFNLDRTATGLLALTAFVVMFQNCGSRFAIDKTNLVNLGSNGPGPKPNPLGQPTPTPTPTPQHLVTDMNGSWPAGKKVDNCLTDTTVNLCVIYNNPVMVNQGGFSPALTSTNTTTEIENRIITYGLIIPKTGQLKNNFFSMRPINGVSAAPDAKGNWKYQIKGDNGHRLSQAHTFYWLNRQKTVFTERTGRFFLSNQLTNVDAFSAAPSAQDNAFWDGATINLGARSVSGGKSDLALDASIVLHEAGHGNLQFASQITGFSRNCVTKNGCSSAIHEGVGDFHSLIVFGEGVVGAYFTNSLTGLRSTAAFKTSGKTAAQMFALRNGEVHDMGEVYASIWYEVWVKAKQAGKERDVETVFTDHMTALGNSSTFVTAFNAISAIATQKNLTYLINDFRAEYQRVQITLP